jgi:hypothetical protein
MSNVGTQSKGEQTPTDPLTIADLREIRKGLGKYRKKLTGQSVWTCCLLAFWGAFRLGELLGSNGFIFDKFSSLLWEDVELAQNSAKIKIKSAKIRGPPGNSASLFSIPNKDLCPVLALTRLKASQLNLGMGEKRSPVFRESGGKFLTKKTFLDTVNAVGKGKETPITGKSFRTALPSALENFPSTFRESHVKALGRWGGRSYQVYMRNDQPEFQGVFNMVASVLLKNDSLQGSQRDDPTTWTGSWKIQKEKSPRKQNPVPARKRRATRRGTKGKAEKV